MCGKRAHERWGYLMKGGIVHKQIHLHVMGKWGGEREEGKLQQDLLHDLLLTFTAS